MDSQADGWLREHPKVEVTLPGRPEGDWRDEEGYGWIAKVWFRTWGDARTAKAAIGSEGWTARRRSTPAVMRFRRGITPGSYACRSGRGSLGWTSVPE